MNTDLLRTWLTLPPGPWPPDDRTLLGLGSGTLTVQEVEQNALAQMEKLRPHQLVSPELVTEGMNRLAQALITLTEEANRPTRPPNPVPAEDLVLDADLIAGPTPAVVLEAEVVSVPVLLDPPPAKKPRKRARKTQVRRKKTRRRQSPADTVDDPVAEAVPPGTTYSPAERRRGYRQLTALRRVLRAWENLRPYFAAPSEPVDTPGGVFGFVEAVRECRRVVGEQDESDWFNDPGLRISVILQHPLPLAVFRDLVFQQRQEVAAEWAQVTAHLKGRYQGLREEMLLSKPRKAWGVSAKRATSWLNNNPEWMLGALIFVAVVIAFTRTIGNRP